MKTKTKYILMVGIPKIMMDDEDIIEVYQFEDELARMHFINEIREEIPGVKIATTEEVTTEAV